MSTAHDSTLCAVIDYLHVSGQVPQLLVGGGQRPDRRLSEEPRCVKVEEFEENHDLSVTNAARLGRVSVSWRITGWKFGFPGAK